MTIKMDDASVNAMLSALETLWGTSIKWQVWSGAEPADESATPAGTKLVEGTAPSDYFGSPSAGVMSKLGTWTQAAIANGVGSILRLCTSAGVPKFQCTLSMTGAAWAINTAVTLGLRNVAGGKVYVCSQAGTTASSGSGPTGTGTNITDGTAKWDYVSPLGEATIDNTNIGIGQAVTVTSLSFTGPHL